MMKPGFAWTCILAATTGFAVQPEITAAPKLPREDIWDQTGLQFSGLGEQLGDTFSRLGVNIGDTFESFGLNVGSEAYDFGASIASGWAALTASVDSLSSPAVSDYGVWATSASDMANEASAVASSWSAKAESEDNPTRSSTLLECASKISLVAEQEGNIATSFLAMANPAAAPSTTVAHTTPGTMTNGNIPHTATDNIEPSSTPSSPVTGGATSFNNGRGVGVALLAVLFSAVALVN